MPDRAELLRAVAADDTERVRELLRADPALADARDDAGVSALMLSRYRWRMDMVGVLRDARESRGALDVFEAAALGDTTRIDELTARDAAVIGRLSPDGFSLLHLACFFGSEDTVRLLLERGADPSVVSTNTMSNQPLHSAASVKRHAVCAMLLAAGADVNALQHGGWTPLHAAAMSGDAELVTLFLEHGADASITNNVGATALDLARGKEHGPVIRLLEAHTAQDDAPLG